jgi:hypothetical protein
VYPLIPSSTLIALFFELDLLLLLLPFASMPFSHSTREGGHTLAPAETRRVSRICRGRESFFDDVEASLVLFLSTVMERREKIGRNEID